MRRRRPPAGMEGASERDGCKMAQMDQPPSQGGRGRALKHVLASINQLRSPLTLLLSQPAQPLRTSGLDSRRLSAAPKPSGRSARSPSCTTEGPSLRSGLGPICAATPAAASGPAGGGAPTPAAAAAAAALRSARRRRRCCRRSSAAMRSSFLLSIEMMSVPVGSAGWEVG